MRWFKLSSIAYKDDKVDNLYRRAGHKGLVVWYTMLQMMAEEYDGDPEKSVTICAQKLQKSAHISKEKLHFCLTFVELFFNISVTFVEEKLQIRYPKFLKIQTNYKRDGCGKFDRIIDNRIKNKDNRLKNKEKNASNPPHKNSTRRAAKRVSREDFDFLDDEIFSWIKNLTSNCGSNLLKDFPSEILKRVIELAYNWDAERGFKAKSVGNLIRTFLSKDFEAIEHLREKSAEKIVQRLKKESKNDNTGC